jgi:hypothetical protein
VEDNTRQIPKAVIKEAKAYKGPGEKKQQKNSP